MMPTDTAERVSMITREPQPRRLWVRTTAQGWATSSVSTICVANDGDNRRTSSSRAVKRDRAVELVCRSNQLGPKAPISLKRTQGPREILGCVCVVGRARKLPCPRCGSTDRNFKRVPPSVAPSGGCCPLVSRVPLPWKSPLAAYCTPRAANRARTELTRGGSRWASP